MIGISARVELAPADVTEYASYAKKIIPLTLAEKGCQLYGMAIDITNPNIIWISEEWDSESDLFAHLASPHILDFLAFTEKLNIVNMDVRKYDISAAGPLVVPEA
ncbi:MAG: putative quinol monooxygenase [Spongiibacteraceae bacterium]